MRTHQCRLIKRHPACFLCLFVHAVVFFFYCWRWSVWIIRLLFNARSCHSLLRLATPWETFICLSLLDSCRLLLLWAPFSSRRWERGALCQSSWHQLRVEDGTSVVDNPELKVCSTVCVWQYERLCVCSLAWDPQVGQMLPVMSIQSMNSLTFAAT